MCGSMSISMCQQIGETSGNVGRGFSMGKTDNSVWKSLSFILNNVLWSINSEKVKTLKKVYQ